MAGKKTGEKKIFGGWRNSRCSHYVVMFFYGKKRQDFIGKRNLTFITVYCGIYINSSDRFHDL